MEALFLEKTLGNTTRHRLAAKRSNVVVESVWEYGAGLFADTSLERAEVRPVLQQLLAVLAQQTSADPLRREVVCEPVRAFLELRVGARLVGDDQRDPIGDGIDDVLGEIRDVPGHDP